MFDLPNPTFPGITLPVDIYGCREKHHSSKHIVQDWTSNAKWLVNTISSDFGTTLLKAEIGKQRLFWVRGEKKEREKGYKTDIR